ncbi:DNA polymerase III subunit chi [Roseicyclus persicicus]|uniref:DNA polymerase III subunit chi n=1 Tax=Roseicyclus persicicus TaxID=2650661 RepID=A0A7X6H0Q4_9RHOB|nr:DNA polymerase III subunit chi [Roseibacterium persicicum]NKX44741.1 DNA polymerase III subunit chi [Roseibacterium persicicum]
MGEVFFYHLTRSPPDATLRTLLERSLAAGWRVAVRGRTDEALDRLDAALWLGDEEGFLPHGRAGGPHDADQPVLLTTGRAAANRPDCVVSVEGAEIAAEEAAALARAMILFDEREPGAVEAARAQWRALTAAGAKAKYWSEAGGRWEMKAES